MLVYGHRGAAGEAPENTVAGFRHAIERGVRHFELDVQMSRDGKLVVIHDNKVNRTTDRRGKVNQFTARELATMDARRDAPPWPRKRGANIATLETVLTATPETKQYQIEVKSARPGVMQDVAEQLASRFPTPASARRVVITSADLRLHACLQAIAPYLNRGLVTAATNPFNALHRYECDYLIARHTACDEKLIAHAHKYGFKVSAWTVNDPVLIKRLFRLKLHSVITDYPSMALPLVGRLMH